MGRALAIIIWLLTLGTVVLFFSGWWFPKTITAVVFIGLAVMGQRVWAQLRFSDAPPGSFQVEIVAQQFVWNAHYPGPDGKIGHTDPSQIDEMDNPLGIDRNDPAAKDDVVNP